VDIRTTVVPAGSLPVHRDQLRAQRSVTSMGSLYLSSLKGFGTKVSKSSKFSHTTRRSWAGTSRLYV